MLLHIRVLVASMIIVPLFTDVEAAELGTDEIQLPSGTILRVVQPPKAIQGNIKRVAGSLEIMNWKGGSKLQTVCDEFVESYAQFRDNEAAHPEKMMITVTSAQPLQQETCEYDIKGKAIFSAPDGTTLPKQPFRFEKLSFNGLRPFGVTVLARYKRDDIEFPVAEYLVSLPVRFQKGLDMGRYLLATAEKLYSNNKHQVLRLIVAEEDNALLPDESKKSYRYAFLAFRNAEGKIFLIENMAPVGEAIGAGNSEINRSPPHIQLVLFNMRLTEIINSHAKTGLNPFEQAGEYAKTEHVADALAALEASARYSADKHELSSIIVVSRAPLSDSEPENPRFGSPDLGFKAMQAFRRHGTEWVAINTLEEKIKTKKSQERLEDPEHNTLHYNRN